MSNTTDFSVDELQTMKRKQLQSLCKKHGIKANGKNEELVEQLLEATGTDGGEENNKNDTDAAAAAATGDDESEPSDAEGDAEEDSANDPSETESRVSKPQFASVAEQVIAEMETRALSLAESQRKEAVDKYNSAHNIVVAETPRNGKHAEKTAAFDKAHDRIFKDDDSIVNHWSARKTPGKATPNNNKRSNADEGTPGTTKRPRMEVLFTSPTVVKSKSQKLGSGQIKAMTSKVQRTQAPTTDGSKTVIAGSRPQPVDLSKVTPTTLFAGEIAEAKESIETDEAVPAVVPVAEKPETIEDEGVSMISDKSQNVDTQEAEAKTSTSEECDRTEDLIADKAQELSSAAATEAEPLKKSSVVPLPAKLPAKSKPSVAHAATTVPPSKPNSGIVKKEAAKPIPAKPQPTKAAGYRTVESKLKAYLNAKPSEPKVKAVKQIQAKPEPPKNVTAKPSLPSVAPARSKIPVTKQVKDFGKDQSNVPNYMKSTRATENRASKADAKNEQKQPMGKTTIPNTRFKPYSRPPKPSSTVAK